MTEMMKLTDDAEMTVLMPLNFEGIATAGGAGAGDNAGQTWVGKDAAASDDKAFEPEVDIGDPELPPPPDGGDAGGGTRETLGGGDFILVDIVGTSAVQESGYGASASDDYVAETARLSDGAIEFAFGDSLIFEPEVDIGDPELPPPPDGGDAGGGTRETLGGGDFILVDIVGTSAVQGSGYGASASDDYVAETARLSDGAIEFAFGDSLIFEPEVDIGDPELPPPPDGGDAGGGTRETLGGGEIILVDIVGSSAVQGSGYGASASDDYVAETARLSDGAIEFAFGDEFILGM